MQQDDSVFHDIEIALKKKLRNFYIVSKEYFYTILLTRMYKKTINNFFVIFFTASLLLF